MALSFSPPDIRQEDIDAVVEVLKSGWITTGPNAAAFERELADQNDADDVIVTSSATTAMETIYRMLGIGAGDEVIVPAYTYTASASAALHVGAEVVLVDSAPGGFFPTVDAIVEALTPRTKAVVTVDLGGVPYPRTVLREALHAHAAQFQPTTQLQHALGRVAIIDDAAHSLGARLAGKGIGADADFFALSFHAVKNLTTAEGGALGWHLPGIDAEIEGKLRAQARMHILHGQNKDALEKSRAGGWEYDIAFPGHKANMPDVLAALGRSQLRRYEEVLKHRHAIVQAYDAILHPAGIETLDHSCAGMGEGARSAAHLYLALVPDHAAEKRNAIIETLAARGIPTNVHYKPLPMLSAYQNLGFDIDDFPHAHQVYRREISLPLHTLMTVEDAEMIAHALVDEL